MKNTKKEGFKIIGISVRTTNENGQAGKDIGELWGRFMAEGIAEKIPNKVNTEIYSIYTEYEGDYTKPYTTILGCRVENVDTVPEGMVAKSFEQSNYAQFTSKGDLTKGAVYEEWLKIWPLDLDRKYIADFEIYGEKAQNPMDAEVDIFVGIH